MSSYFPGIFFNSPYPLLKLLEHEPSYNSEKNTLKVMRKQGLCPPTSNSALAGTCTIRSMTYITDSKNQGALQGCQPLTWEAGQVSRAENWAEHWRLHIIAGKVRLRHGIEKSKHEVVNRLACLDWRALLLTKTMQRNGDSLTFSI